MHAFLHPGHPAGIFPYMRMHANTCAYANARFFPYFFPRFSAVQIENLSRFFPGIFPGIPVGNPAGILRRFPKAYRRRIRVSGTFSEGSYGEISDVYDGTLRSNASEKSRRDFLKEFVIPFTRFFILFHESVITFMRTITNPLFLFI